MSNFHKFAKAIKDRFDALSKHELFTVTLPGEDKDKLWMAYLQSFPNGTNPVFRINTEHDCSCCRSFIKGLGGVVAIINGKKHSIWDVKGLEYPYDVVAAYMNMYVLTGSIKALFRTTERLYGVEQTTERLENGKSIVWKHFHGRVDDKHFIKPSMAVSSYRVVGDYGTSVSMLSRALETITPEAIETVIELITNKTQPLYRGAQYLQSVTAFKKLQEQFKSSNVDPTLFVWEHALNNCARIRNTSIGGLLVDISEGVELDKAIRAYGVKVDPLNYKHSTAPVTTSMVNAALKVIQDSGLEPSLERRHAKLSDVSINNVLWADNSAKNVMKDGLKNLLMSAVTVPVGNPKQIEEISIEDFMSFVIPKTGSMDVMFKNTMLNQLMSITAPVHADSPSLFQWNNNFAWSYNGNVTDSIKERVKAAGGNVIGELCCRLAWDYDCDLDFHMEEPGYHIYYGNKRVRSPNGGMLDVDANGGDGIRKDPVENIFYNTISKMKPGNYRLIVHNFNRRQTTKKGFEVEIELLGKRYNYVYPHTLKEGDKVTVATLVVDRNGITVQGVLPESTASKQVWGIETEKYVPVDTLMLSPNFWDENTTGNKHWFFILKGCNNHEPTRGIYNEFLDGPLFTHRKTFEVLGNKTMCQPTTDQLSGIGFSSTRKDSVIVRVTNNDQQRHYNVTF